PAEIDEYSKHQVTTDEFETMTEPFLRSEAPYAWGQNSPTDDAQLAAEWICKQVKGYPPIAGVTSGEPTFNPKANRKFASIEINLAHFDSGPTLLSGLATCGVNPTDQTLAVDSPNAIENALLQDQSNNVSSIILNTDIVDAILIMSQAQSLRYYPEWLTTGWGLLDDDAYLTRDAPASELAHLFGLSTTEINRAPNVNECYVAVASVDPGFVAHPLYCHLFWEMISHLVDAIQLAGPHLTPQTLARAYTTIPNVTISPANNWAIIGGFSNPARRAWADAASVYWWDPGATDADGGKGTYAYADCAARYLAGQFPTRPAQIFTSSGYVTGLTFGQRCTPPGAATQPSAGVQRVATSFLELSAMIRATALSADVTSSRSAVRLDALWNRLGPPQPAGSSTSLSIPATWSLSLDRARAPPLLALEAGSGTSRRGGPACPCWTKTEER
ncbi:MAG: hypothetical protein ACYCO3_16980, partial [Mycobacteriales bacterium]